MQPDRTRADTKSSSIVLNCEEPRFLYERTREKTNSDYWVTTPKDSTEVLFIGQRCEILHTPPPGTDSCCCPYRANFFPHSSTKAHPSSRSPPPPRTPRSSAGPAPYLHAVVAFPRVRHQQHDLPFGRPFILTLRIPFARGSLQPLGLLPVLLRSLAGPARPLRHRERHLHGRSGGRGVGAGAEKRRRGPPAPGPIPPAPHARSAVGTLRSRRAAPSAAPASARPGHAATYGARRVRRYGGRAGAALRLRGAERGGPSRVCRAGRFGAAPAVRL